MLPVCMMIKGGVESKNSSWIRLIPFEGDLLLRFKLVKKGVSCFDVPTLSGEVGSCILGLSFLW